MPAIVSAVSRGVAKTLSDGTVRFTIDIEPQNAGLAFGFMGMPGAPVAIARLAPGTILPEQESPAPEQPQPQQSQDKPKGGSNSRQAALVCAGEPMRRFVARVTDLEVELSTEEQAAAFVRDWCGIESRAELDSNPRAWEAFGTLMAQLRRFSAQEAQS